MACAEDSVDREEFGSNTTQYLQYCTFAAVAMLLPQLLCTPTLLPQSGECDVRLLASTEELAELETDGRVVRGALRPGGAGIEWCDPDVLRRLRRRSRHRTRPGVDRRPTTGGAPHLTLITP